MPHFLMKLVSPRASFPHDMSDPEREAMGGHTVYWVQQAEAGVAVVVGPVADPSGFWGMAVVEAADDAAAERLAAADPIISGNLGFRYETYAMPQVILRPGAGTAAAG